MTMDLTGRARGRLRVQNLSTLTLIYLNDTIPGSLLTQITISPN